MSADGGASPARLVDVVAIERRARNEIAANTQAEGWIASVSNGDVLALVEAVEAAQAHVDALSQTGERDLGFTDDETGEHHPMPVRVRRATSPSTLNALREALAPFASAHPADAPLPEGEDT